MFLCRSPSQKSTGKRVFRGFELSRMVFRNFQQSSAVFQTVRSGSASQKFAIKLISADTKNADDQLRRWQQSEKLADPNLLRVFESGRCEIQGTALLYVMLEFAEEDLSQILPERALTSGEVRQMLPPVLKALAYVHVRGFVHGRIRPSNIMAAGDQVKLAGDPLRPATETTNRASQGNAKELSAYDPPESASGQLSQASDIWMLGVTLTEILTQRPPTWDRRSPAGPVLPQGLTEPFLEIIQRSLQVDPQKRWTAGEIAAHLQPAQPATKVIPASAPTRGSASVPASIEARTSPKWPYVIAVVLAVLIAWALIPKSKKQESPTPLAQVEPQQVPATPSPAASERPSTSRQAKPSPSTPDQSANIQQPTKPSDAFSTKGAVSQRVLPRVSASARNTVEGKIKVRVRVEVDPSGNVTEANLAARGPSKYFARVALEASRDWKFTPPQVGGQAVASQWILQFGFRRTGTEVTPKQVSP